MKNISCSNTFYLSWVGTGMTVSQGEACIPHIELCMTKFHKYMEILY